MICEAYAPAILTVSVLAAFNPRPDVRTWDWICENGRTHKGEPFDGDRLPWCEGVCDALDDPAIRAAVLPWGTRTGKTTISMQWMASTAALKPMPGLFATSTGTLAKKTVRRKIYPMLDAIAETRRQLPPPRMRALEEIRLSSSPWGVAWAGSETQLADVEAYYGWANEIDKWTMSQRLDGEAGEGDALDQWDERFKENPDHKKIYECSPSTLSHSRIWPKLMASNNCRYWVPCPKCRRRQVLKMGANDPRAGGILFDRAADGTLDPAVAKATARYVCEHCHYEIHDDQRPRMMRAGKWAPEGCSVDMQGRVVGEAKRDGEIWGGQLSSLYSLQLRWGDVAAKFVNVIGRPASLRMFVNGWLGETWDPHPPKNKPEEVGERLATDVPRGVIPIWATWLFAAVDIQGDHYVWVVVACGPGERIALVDDGEAETLDWIAENVIKKRLPHQDAGGPLWPAVTLVDSGFRTADIYRFCQKFRGTPHKVMPCKGANTDCGGEAFEVKTIGVNEGTSARTKKALIIAGRGLKRIRVNPYYYEPLLQDQLDNKNPGEDGGLSLHAEAGDDIELLKDLCNGAESNTPSKSDPNRHLWIKPRESDPNDKRDALGKYARCAMDWKFKRNWARAEKRQPASVDRSRRAPAASVASVPSDDRGGQRARKRFKPEFRRRGR
jgi:phage terminase large subunit GpA-like protein